MDCTFCLDCVKACPHDNIGILTLAPGRDLVRDSARSSLGRFSRRRDIAVLALVVVSSAFVSAASMVAPLAAWHDRLTGWFFPLALVLAPALLVQAATYAGRLLARIRKPGRELFCRFSLALVPVGLAMWAAHVLFHLSTAWSTAWPVVQRAAGDLGIPWLGAPRWIAPVSLFTPDTMLAIQILLMDAGLLLSLYAGWRIARACTDRAQDGLLLLAPWAAITSCLYAAGIWLVLQPMQMRGMVHG